MAEICDPRLGSRPVTNHPPGKSPKCQIKCCRRNGLSANADEEMLTEGHETLSPRQIPLQILDDRRMQRNQALRTRLGGWHEQRAGFRIEVAQTKPKHLCAPKTGTVEQSNNSLVGEGTQSAGGFYASQAP